MLNIAPPKKNSSQKQQKAKQLLKAKSKKTKQSIDFKQNNICEEISVYFYREDKENKNKNLHNLKSKKMTKPKSPETDLLSSMFQNRND